MIEITDRKFMEVAVYVGDNGDLVLSQEWPSLNRGDRFLRVMVDMKDAEKLAMNILSVARAARDKGQGGG